VPLQGALYSKFLGAGGERPVGHYFKIINVNVQVVAVLVVIVKLLQVNWLI
jgi:hypothetical protein